MNRRKEGVEKKARYIGSQFSGADLNSTIFDFVCTNFHSSLTLCAFDIIRGSTYARNCSHLAKWIKSSFAYCNFQFYARSLNKKRVLLSVKYFKILLTSHIGRNCYPCYPSQYASVSV